MPGALYRTPFFARERELRALATHVAAAEPVIVITGPAGIGKTRLAAELLARLAPQRAAYFCDVARCRDGDQLVAALAACTRLELAHSLGTADDFGARLDSLGPSIVVLDNFECVASFAAPLVECWLDLAPDVQWILTSRTQVGLDVAVRLILGPLEQGELGPDSASGALGLFTDRARRARATFAIDQKCCEELESIVRLLRGNPLAIELAATRCRLLSPRSLLEHLQTHLLTLRTRGGANRDRYHSLADAIDFSWNALPAFAREVLAALSVFPSRFDIAAAESVLGASQQGGTVVEALESLSDLSLITPCEGPAGSAGLDMHLGVREFAAAKLEPRRRVDLERRHAAWLLRGALDRIDSFDRQLEWLEAHREDLLAVHSRSVDRGEAPDVDHAMAAALLLVKLLAERGPGRQLARTLDDVRVFAGQKDGDPRLYGRVLLANARQSYRLAPAEALDYLTAAVGLADELADSALQARARYGLGVHHLLRVEHDEAQRWLREVVERTHGVDSALEGHTLVRLAHIASSCGHPDRARRQLTEALALFRGCADPYGEAIASLGLVRLDLAEGRPADARVRLELVLELNRDIDSRAVEADASLRLARALSALGEIDVSEARFHSALALYRELGNRHGEAVGLLHFAVFQASRGDPSGARQSLARSEALIAALGRPHMVRCREAAVAVVDATQATDATLPAEERQRLLAHAGRTLERLTNHQADTTASSSLLGDLLGTLRVRLALGQDGRERFLVSRRGEWFEAPGAARVNLHHRRTLANILRALVEALEKPPPRRLTLARLIEVGWPGESIGYESGASRVYVAVSTLRKLGLGDRLQRDEGGYSLDAGADLVVRD